MKISDGFLAGLIISLIIGGGSMYFHNNYKMKQVIDKHGNVSTCQVIHYRFWYEIKNCSKPEMNQKMVGLNEIKNYQVQ